MSSDREIWKYQSEDGGHRVTVYEKDGGVIVLRAAGVMTAKGSSELLDFIEAHAEKVGRKVKVISDNTEVDKMEREARKVAARFVDSDSPIGKLATFGDNFAMRAFMNLYATLARIPVRFCSSESEAEAWLLRGDAGDEK